MGCFEYECRACEFLWEDICSYKDPIPSVCPDCGAEGQIEKLLSLTAQGKVELYGHELKSKLREDGRKMKAEAMRSEDLYANLVGENNYTNNLAAKKKADENRPKIKMKKTDTLA